MYLFIFESIGTSELLLIGIVALIFLGPRKMPEMARKLGKIMAEFRNTTNEFKETWQREANMDEEMKVFDLNAIEAETIERSTDAESEPTATAGAPEIKQLDPADFERLKNAAAETTANSDLPAETSSSYKAPNDSAGDKTSWL